MRPLKYRRRWYVGVPARSREGFKAFQCAYTPSQRKQGRIYLYVIGPFRSKRGALWAEKFGFGNPAFYGVAAAERISKSREESEIAKED
jgi:hypothetical protein